MKQLLLSGISPWDRNKFVFIAFTNPGHRAYLKGSATFKKVVEAFGEDVVGEDGEIHRPSLGRKVFGNKVL